MHQVAAEGRTIAAPPRTAKLPERGGDAIFERLVAEGRLAIAPSVLFQSPPPAPQSPVTRDRVRGMLLGLAIGDALGNTTESLWPWLRRFCVGEIRSYLPNSRALGRRVGLPSDGPPVRYATDLRLRSLSASLSAKCRRRFGVARSGGEISGKRGRDADRARLAAAPVTTRSGSLDRRRAGRRDHAQRPRLDRRLREFVGMLWQLLGMQKAPPADWWANSYVGYAKSLEGSTRYRARRGFTGWRPRVALDQSFEGPIWRFVEERLRAALHSGDSAATVAQHWKSSAYLLETVPTALFILAKHAADPEETIVRAVNDTYDNDTIGAIVGAAVGALHGEGALPRRWRENLLGRTATADDGRVFELVAAAERFVP